MTRPCVLCVDDDALGSVHEQLAVNLAAASEEVSMPASITGVVTACSSTQPYQWLDVEVAVIEVELRRSGMATKRRRPQQSIKKAPSVPAVKIISVSEVKREPGMPWRTAARSMHR